MESSSRKEKDCIIIKVKGRLNAESASEFEQECQKWIDQGENKLIVDLKDLEYISSAGLRAILASGKKIKTRGGTLSLCNLSGMVLEVIKISGFSSIFPTFDNLEAALEA